VCALKAGRLDRLTPDDGLTFIDFIAFQEAPKSASAGQVVMPNWWDGTQCKSVTFEVSLNRDNQVKPISICSKYEKTYVTISPF